MPSINLAEVEIDAGVLKLVPREICEKHQVIPVRRNGATLIVAMADPSNIYAIDELKFLTQYNIEPVVASEGALETALSRYYDKGPDFDQMIGELRSSRYAGDQLVAHNMALNVDIRAYHAYSFQTVAESDSGRLIEEFLRLPMPSLFLYGETNKGLSYLPRLRGSPVRVREVPSSAHFLFYDDPVATFQAVGEFVREHAAR